MYPHPQSVLREKGNQHEYPNSKPARIERHQGQRQGVISLPNRSDAAHTGSFRLNLDVHFDPSSDNYLVISKLELNRIDLVDSVIKGDVIATTIEQISSWGKYTPTMTLTGRCRVKSDTEKPVVGCRYWLLLALNRPQAPDMVSYVVFDRKGVRVSHATGAVSNGTFTMVTPGE